MWRRLLVITGLAALAAWLVRRQRPGEAPAPDPSDELRRRLDDARRREEDVQVATPAEPPAPPDLDRRRRDVHERARAAVDEMRSEPE